MEVKRIMLLIIEIVIIILVVTECILISLNIEKVNEIHTEDKPFLPDGNLDEMMLNSCQETSEVEGGIWWVVN